MVGSTSSNTIERSAQILTLTVQFLIDLFAFVIPKHLTLRGRLRGSGGGPMGSSLPRHGARIRTKTQSKKETKPRTDCKLAHKDIEQKLYDA